MKKDMKENWSWGIKQTQSSTEELMKTVIFTTDERKHLGTGDSGRGRSCKEQ